MTTMTRPTGPKGRPLIGHLASVRADQLGFLLACARDYGDVVDLRYGPRPVLLLNNPTDIEAVLVGQNRSFVKGRFYALLEPMLGNGLFTSEGAFWLHQRRLMQPAFHRERVASYGAVMVEYAEQTVAGWPEGAVLDVQREMAHLTLRIVCK